MKENNAFVTVVTNSFSQIIVEKKYLLVETFIGYVRLESRSASITIHYDYDKSFEVGIEFSKLLRSEFENFPYYNLGEVFRYFCVPDANKNSFFQSTNIQLVQNFLESTSSILLKYCMPILAGQQDCFTGLSNLRKQEVHNNYLNDQLVSVYDVAKKAWHEKEYEEFFNMLNNFREILPKSERMKLDYARKNIKKKE